MNQFIPKTGGIEGPGPVKGVSKPVKENIKGDPGAFRRALNEQLEGDEKADKPTLKDRLPEIQSPVKIPSIDASFDTRQYTEEIDASLDLLETYAAVLDDPEKTLKQAGSLLDTIMKKMALLSSEIEASPPEDPNLLRILKQLIGTAEIEKIKFDRGDYAV